MVHRLTGVERFHMQARPPPEGKMRLHVVVRRGLRATALGLCATTDSLPDTPLRFTPSFSKSRNPTQQVQAAPPKSAGSAHLRNWTLGPPYHAYVVRQRVDHGHLNLVVSRMEQRTDVYRERVNQKSRVSDSVDLHLCRVFHFPLDQGRFVSLFRDHSRRPTHGSNMWLSLKMSAALTHRASR